MGKKRKVAEMERSIESKVFNEMEYEKKIVVVIMVVFKGFMLILVFYIRIA